MMILGADEGSEGDKSKVFAMQEGMDEADITDDDYRFTAELRGRNYGAPGSVTYRIIAGDGVSRDGARVQLSFSTARAGTSGSSRGRPGRPRSRCAKTVRTAASSTTRPSAPAATRTGPNRTSSTSGRPDRPRRRDRRDAARGHDQERLGVLASAPGVRGRIAGNCSGSKGEAARSSRLPLRPFLRGTFAFPERLLRFSRLSR